MVDPSFGDLELAALYDGLNPWGPDDDFYLELVRGAGAVLDVGCGTGRLLARARETGHRGRLTGLDPAAAMLVQARRRAVDVEWVLGDLDSTRRREEFDLVVMTGHAFQELVADETLRRALAAVRAALVPGGRFVFETRNPAARAWERWTPDRIHRTTAADGTPVRLWHEVLHPVVGDRVTFTGTFESPLLPRPRVTRNTLRFLGADGLDRFLTEAGLTVRRRYGDWRRGPLTPAAPEIVTVAERSGG